MLIRSRAFDEAERFEGRNTVSTEHILLSIAATSGDPCRTAPRAQRRDPRCDPAGDGDDFAAAIGSPLQNPEATYRAIDQYARDLYRSRATLAKLDPVIGRDERNPPARMQILARRTKKITLSLIGEPGVGKTAIAPKAIAQRIVAGDVLEILKTKRLVSLDLASLIAGLQNIAASLKTG